MLKKILLVIILFTSMNVYASSGALKKSSIKTCPDGITYGSHKGEGTLHYHKATYNGKQYYPDGNAIANDPCPKSGNAVKKSTRKVTTKKQMNVTSTKIPKTNVTKEITTTSIRSSDTTINKITINGEEYLNVSENSDYIIYKNKVDISVVLNDSKSKVDIIGDKDNFNVDENREIVLKVVAEDESEKLYTLNIQRKIKESDSVIKKFVVDGNTANISSSLIEVNVFSYPKVKDIVYQLDDSDAFLTLYHDDKVLDLDENLQYDVAYKVLLTDAYSNTKEYTLKVKKYTTTDIIGMGIVAILIFRIPIGVIIFLIYLIKKKWICYFFTSMITGRIIGLLPVFSFINIFNSSITWFLMSVML